MGKPLIHRLFPTAVAEFDCISHLQNKKAFYEAFPDHRVVMDDGGILTGEASGFIYLHNDERLAPLFNFAAECTQQYMLELRMKTELFSTAIVKSWVTLTDDNFHVPVHTHATSHFSFVYYVEIPDNSDSLSFCIDASPNEPYATAFSSKWGDNPLMKNIINDYIDINSNQWTFPVKEGKLFVFPSTLPHKTVKIGDLPKGSLRVSVAGDVLLIYKEQHPNYPTGLFDPNTWKIF